MSLYFAPTYRKYACRIASVLTSAMQQIAASTARRAMVCLASSSGEYCTFDKMAFASPAVFAVNSPGVVDIVILRLGQARRGVSGVYRGKSNVTVRRRPRFGPPAGLSK